MHMCLKLITTLCHVGPIDSHLQYLPALRLCDLAVDCVLLGSASVALIFHTHHTLTYTIVLLPHTYTHER